MQNNTLIQYNINLLLRCFLLTLITCFWFIESTIAQKVTISGYIKEKGSHEDVVGASIFIPDLKIGSQTNNYGFFSITFLKKDSITLRTSMVGYKLEELKISARESKNIIILIEPQSSILEEVIVKANEQEKKSTTTKISTINIPIKQLKDVPSLMGEKDIIKAIQLLPGVQNGTEGSNGLFVRGGGSDQNLILMDEAKVYNVSHLFGFFSVFNGDALKSLEFIKGGFPARYGGRISSVLDVQMKEGNKNSTHGEIGVGLITNRITLEAPIKKNKSSFIISARRTYPDLLFSLFKNSNGGALKSNFYDVNAKANFDLNKNNRLFLSTYIGQDNLFERINKSGDSFRNVGFSWGNRTGTLRWNHIFTPKTFSNLSLIYSKFDYTLENTFGTSSQLFSSKLNEVGVKYDIEYLPNTKHNFRFGINISQLNFIPSLSISKENGNRVNNKEIEQIKALDGAIYIEDVYHPTSKLSFNYGIRGAFFTPSQKVYTFLEPRLAINYNFKENWALKGGFSIMNQPIQLLTNNGLGLSIDIWVPSSAKIPPQNSQQFTLGLVHDFSKKLSIELEVYTKKMKNILAFREGASILSTVSLFRDRDFTTSKISWENISTFGNGSSNGVELFIHKNAGRFTGWISYTLAKTTYQFKDLNAGKVFFPIHDRRHQLSTVGVFKRSEKLKFSGNFVLSTGNPVTLPQLTYETFDIDPFKNDLSNSYTNVIDYGNQRNQYRTPIYNRLDLSVQFLKNKKHGIRTWELGFYNILGRKNVFAYDVEINGKISSTNTFIRTKTINEVSFLLFIPSISYYFKF